MIEAAKSTINKYVKRERNKQLSPDANFWDFRCKFGIDADSAQKVHHKQLFSEIDKLNTEEVTSFYVELTAFEATRRKG